MFPVLTAPEAGELAECEAIVERGIETFLEVGTALLKIRDGRLYRQTFGTFEDYCRVRWGMSRIHAHRMIEAAQVAENVLPIGNTPPSSESQLRPLVRLEPEQQREAYKRAVDLAPNGKPTARQVEEAAEAVAPRPVPVHQPIPDQRPLWSDFEPDDEPEVEEEDSSDDEPEFTEDEPEPILPADPDAGWTDSELERRDRVMLSGLTVLANQRKDADQRLIAWAKARGLYVPIDRSSYPLGNPMAMDADHDRAAVIAWYRDHWLPFHHEQIDWDSLGGKVLGCWCYPEPCHGNVIIEQLPNEDAGHEAE